MLVSVALCQRNETAAFYASHDRSHHAEQKLDFSLHRDTWSGTKNSKAYTSKNIQVR